MKSNMALALLPEEEGDFRADSLLTCAVPTALFAES